MTGLVGYTGFIGQNLLKQYNFDYTYNSKNISDIYNMHFDLLFISGISANKVFANTNPEEDLYNIQSLIYHLSKCSADRVVLISTIDVHNDDFYGLNRLYAESEICKIFNNTSIIRLPGLYGSGLKKNLIFDIYNLCPKYLTKKYFDKLCETISDKSELVKVQNSFIELDGIYTCKDISILDILCKYNFTSLQFTNPNSTFQFFNVSSLKSVIDKMLAENNHNKLLEISSEPISARELCEYVGVDVNLLGVNSAEVYYNKIFGEIWKAKSEILDDIRDFIRSN